MKERISKLKRKLGVKNSDVDGTMAVLQIARRLLAEDGTTAVYSALNDALPYAAAKDDGIAWWAAHHALVNALPYGYNTLGGYVHDGGATNEQVLDVFDLAIKNQGTMKVELSKGKRAK